MHGNVGCMRGNGTFAWRVALQELVRYRVGFYLEGRSLMYEYDIPGPQFSLEGLDSSIRFANTKNMNE